MSAAPEPGAAPAGEPVRRAPGLMEIAAAARTAVAFFTELPVDQVASCRRQGDGWVAVVDVVESRARLGDNDMLASYEVTLGPDGAVEALARTGRYLRDDAAGGGAGA